MRIKNKSVYWVNALWVLSSFAGAAAEAPKRNPKLLALKPNVWVKLHEQKPGETVTFMRQAHGGSCFDTRRGQLILFGSNTHGRDWKNSPFFYDPAANAWSRAYPDDALSTYTVNPEGLPVAGAKGEHPWATHTFGGVIYDSARDEMVIVCYPGHMRPSKWGKAVAHLWGRIKKHPTWTYNLKTGAWRPLPGKAVSFFPHSAAYDSDRGAIIGYRPDGIFELSGEPRTWKRVVKRGVFPGWHDNCAYDGKHKALVIFGWNKNSNEIGVYYPATGEHKKMPTKGRRPPKDQHAPMAFHPRAGQTVVLVDRTRKKDGAARDSTETWCYDLGKDAWTQIKSATLPFACGMNYNMEYDPGHGVLLLVSGGYHGRTTVWALRVDLRKARQ